MVEYYTTLAALLKGLYSLESSIIICIFDGDKLNNWLS